MLNLTDWEFFNAYRILKVLFLTFSDDSSILNLYPKQIQVRLLI